MRIALWTLPIAQYPDIAPPTVQVTAAYPGANAKTVADTVATPIEQQINGVENMLYMSSSSTSDGIMTLNVTFKLGTDLDEAQVLVQNRVDVAMPTLPAGGAAHRRDDEEAVAGHHDGRASRLAGRLARFAFSRATTRCCRSATNSRGSPASAT